MARYATVDTILNDVAVESGLAPIAAPFDSSDPAFIQLRYLLNSSGQELLELYPWEILRRKHTITTDSATYPDARYPLPADFGFMIDQTSWDQSSNVPLQGGVTPQQWAFLEGRDLSSSTIFVTFRMDAGELQLYPATIADGRVISFYYISRYWAEKGSSPSIEGLYDIDAGTNTVRYEPILIKRMLKMKFQAAKGFDNTNSTQEFYRALDAWTGKSKAAQVLSASARGRTQPFLNVWRNAPDSGYGI
tara:strand:- start:2035 stop:2778 length:744 start_codon:yes stop_codon:yes gene_type:complete